MYSSISQFEPLLPQDPKKVLHSLALDVLRESARLSGMLHPITRQALVGVVRTMNCYYLSNNRQACLSGSILP